MPDVQAEIRKYAYELRVTPDERVGLLSLHSSERTLAVVAFVEPDQPLPPPRENLNGTVAIAYRFEQLQEVIDLLRNEKPVHFTWNSAEQIARIATDLEPIGEGERRGILATLFG